jgi:transcriptional activator of cad operon
VPASILRRHSVAFRAWRSISPVLTQSAHGSTVRNIAAYRRLAREPGFRPPLLVAGIGTPLLLAVAFLVYGRFGTVHQRTAPNAPPTLTSIAVLPFLDLTSESMDQEYFADGMTEELIDRLSKIPGLRVPPPTMDSWSGPKPMIARWTIS